MKGFASFVFADIFASVYEKKAFSLRDKIDLFCLSFTIPFKYLIKHKTSNVHYTIHLFTDVTHFADYYLEHFTVAPAHELIYHFKKLPEIKGNNVMISFDSYSKDIALNLGIEQFLFSYEIRRDKRLILEILLSTSTKKLIDFTFSDYKSTINTLRNLIFNKIVFYSFELNINFEVDTNFTLTELKRFNSFKDFTYYLVNKYINDKTIAEKIINEVKDLNIY